MNLVNFNKYNIFYRNAAFSSIGIGAGLGTGLGALRGATTQEAFVDPVTGQKFYKQVGIINRAGRVIGGGVTGGLLGATAGGGVSLVRKANQYKNSLPPIENR